MTPNPSCGHSTAGFADHISVADCDRRSVLGARAGGISRSLSNPHERRTAAPLPGRSAIACQRLRLARNGLEYALMPAIIGRPGADRVQTCGPRKSLGIGGAIRTRKRGPAATAPPSVAPEEGPEFEARWPAGPRRRPPRYLAQSIADRAL